MSEDMREIRQLGKRPRRRWLDILVGVVLLVIILFLAHSLFGQLNLKHEVKDAKAVSNQMMNDIRKQDGASALKLGDKTFNSQNNVTQLNAGFKSVSKFTSGTPTIDQSIVTNDSAGQAVSVIYRFPSKPVVYARIYVIRTTKDKTFQVDKLFINNDEKKLIKDAQ